MSAPASSSAASSVSNPTTHRHSALDFFDAQPTSFVNLLKSKDSSWHQLGHSQLAGAIGVPPSDFDELQPTKIPAAEGGWLPAAAQEQAEVEEFIAWVQRSEKLVRQVIEVLPGSVYQPAAQVILSAELHDFSPKGRVDDEIFEKHRDVWERITRGCAVLKLMVRDQAQPIWRWAVRANRKFTGHEDDAAAADAKLYCVPGVPESVVVSHKCNGSVLHLSARDIEIHGQTYRWVFLGSKKVHVGCIWRDAHDWLTQMKQFNAERHDYVSEMVQYIEPHLKARGQLILDTLARFRLVINAEYVSSIGTGPTDNERIYGLSPEGREAFAFMLTFNTLFPAPGCELGLDMMAGLRLMHFMGFKTVSAFQLPLTALPAAKVQVIPLPDIEGAVLYYSSSKGLVQLEKWKSSGYVVLRAVREKLRPLLYGSRDKFLGLEQLIQNMDQEQAKSGLVIEKKVVTPAEIEKENQPKKKKKPKKKKNKNAKATEQDEEPDVQALAIESDGGSAEEEQKSATPAPAPSSATSSLSSPTSATAAVAVAAALPPAIPDTYLELTHAQLDSLGSFLTTHGGRRVTDSRWRVPCPVDPETEAALRQTIQQQFAARLIRAPVDFTFQNCLNRIQGRIKSIDHIPMTPEERTGWLVESEAFLNWLLIQLVEVRRWAPKEVMNSYSKLWTIFRQEAKQHRLAAEQKQNA